MQKTFCDKCGEEIKNGDSVMVDLNDRRERDKMGMYAHVLEYTYHYELCYTCFDSLNLKAKPCSATSAN